MNDARRIDGSGWAARAALAGVTIAAYGRTFGVPLLFDDDSSIAENPSIRRLWPIGPVLHPPVDAVVGGRPLLNLSFALNHAFGGTAVFGYHLVNLLIHVLAGWTLFALVRSTLRRPVLAERFGAAATPLALSVSALWSLHPLQTEAVTYLSERAESLMGLFYLLTVYCFVRYADGDGDTEARRPPLRGGGRLASVSSLWAALSVLACLAGVATKEVIATAPLMVLLYDRTFVSGGFAAAWRRHRWLYAGLAATWVPLGWLMFGLNHRGVGFGQGLTAWAYALIECRVVVQYLRLVFWPRPLVFDYGMFPIPAWVEVWPYLVVLAGLAGATGWMLLGFGRSVEFGRPAEPERVRLRPLGFGGQALGFAGAWFFLILAPTSSIIPVAGQPMGENRLYLPLAGVVALAVCGAYRMVGRWSWLLVAMVAAALGLATAQRNRTYLSETAIWSDTVAKRPENARAHGVLGHAWSVTPGGLNEAVAQFHAALRLNPGYAEAHTNLGSALARQPGRLPEAIAEFEAAVRLKPGLVEAHNNLGFAWSTMPGRLDDAIAEFTEAVRLKPDYAEAHFHLGSCWAAKPGHSAEAIAEFETALRLQPDYPDAHNNLGMALARQPGRLDDAIAQFEEALRLEPELAEAHYNLGNAWTGTPGRLDEAIAEYREAVRLKPDYVEAYDNLGIALARLPGRMDEAVAEYEEAVRLKPDYAEAHNNLGIALAQLPGRMNDAIGEFVEALRLSPDDAATRRNLAAALRQSDGNGAPPPAAR